MTIKKMRRPHVTANAPLHRPRVLGIAALAALCVYVIYQMTSSATDWYSDSVGGTTGAGGRCPAADYVVTLARHATPDKFIILALVDTAFADMALNLYESSLRPNGINNFLFVGAGRRACEILSNASLPCYHYTEDQDTEVASIYKSPEFIRKMNIRTDMILDALSVGFTVLHTDLDVVFLRNPLPDLKVVMLSADIATMWDSVAHNAGFVVVKPTWFARSVYERMKRMTTYSHKTDDQTAMNSAIYSMNRIYKRRGFKAVTLDSKKYLCGLDYFEKGNRVFPSVENCSDCAVVHNNWIVSREAKIYRFKEHLMWMHDKDSYYSSETQNYLVYHNPNIWSTVDANDREELAALRASLALGHLLGRAVVLPRFHCSLNGGGLGGPPPGSASSSSSSSRWSTSAASRYRRRPVHRGLASAPSTTGPPAVPSHECPLNGLLNITAFDAQFNERYRENSFLHHPLVPDLIRADRSTLFSVHGVLRLERGDEIDREDAKKFQAAPVNESSIVTSSSSAASTYSMGGGSRGDPLPRSAVTLSSSDALRLFGGVGSRVLELRSLYRINVVFDDVDAQKDFDARVTKAFQRGTYRQL